MALKVLCVLSPPLFTDDSSAGACAPTSMYREIFSAVGFKKLDVVNIEGEMGPMANGFRLIVVRK